MAMQWLENELRKSGLPGDTERAEHIRIMLTARGQDISLPGEQKKSDTHFKHGLEGRRKYVVEQQPDGKSLRVPQELYQPEISILQYAVKLADESQGSQRFYGMQVAHLMESTADPIRSGGIYKLLGRLEKWAYLDAEREQVDPSNVGRPIRTYYMVTAAGRIRSEKPTL